MEGLLQIRLYPSDETRQTKPKPTNPKQILLNTCIFVANSEHNANKGKKMHFIVQHGLKLVFKLERLHSPKIHQNLGLKKLLGPKKILVPKNF